MSKEETKANGLIDKFTRALLNYSMSRKHRHEYAIKNSIIHVEEMINLLSPSKTKTMSKVYCKQCGKELIPAPAKFDGEATFVGYMPHDCQPKVYLADYKNKKFVKKATMEEPTYAGMPASKCKKDIPLIDIDYYNKKISEYNDHLASLPSYRAEWITKEMDGQEKILDVDFYLEQQFWEGTSWWPIKHLVDGKVKLGANVRTAALPLQPSVSSEEVPDQFYPDSQYQRLFDWLMNKNFMALNSEMREVIDIVHKDFPSLPADDVEGKETKGSDVTDDSLLIVKDWKKAYEDWSFKKEQTYFPTPIEQIAWIEDNILNGLKSQIAGYRFLTRKLIERRDELISQLNSASPSPKLSDDVEQMAKDWVKNNEDEFIRAQFGSHYRAFKSGYKAKADRAVEFAAVSPHGKKLVEGWYKDADGNDFQIIFLTSINNK